MKREPRALAPSTGLLHALAQCGGTSIKKLRGSRSRQATVSLAALERLEEELGARLHDDILVLLAVRDPVMRLLTGIGEINNMSDAADEGASATPEGYVRISSVYSDPIGELAFDSHGGPYYDIAVKQEPEGNEAQLLVGSDGRWDEAEEITIADFVEKMIDEARAGETSDQLTISPRPDVPPPLEPAPKLVRGRALRRPSRTGGKVTHPKFGIGEVMERTGEGEHEKVLVRFGDSERMLLARFVKPYSEDGRK